MKIVKLRGDEYRAWRVNQAKLVGADGVVIRDVTIEEVNILKELDKRATVGRAMAEAILDEGLETEVRFQVTPVPLPGVVTMGLKRTINGNAIVMDRDLIKAALLAKHGPCQVRTMAGQPKFTVRDPSNQPSRSVSGAQSGTPMPDNCPTCQAYAGRQPGRHHWICQWNDRAPPEERGSKDGTVITQVAAPPGTQPAPQPVAPRVRFLPTAAPVAPPVVAAHVAAPVPTVAAGVSVPPFLRPQAVAQKVIDTTATPVAVAPVAGAPVAVPAAPPPPMSPKECPNNCTTWAQYTGAGHHAICTWKKPWEDLQGGVEVKFLVHLETGHVLREASPEEIAEAALESNLGIATVAGEAYGVLTEADLKKVVEETAAEEAQPAPAATPA